jgi:hypothetical protein
MVGKSAAKLMLTFREQALYHLRSPDHPLRLWIDAICIDQNNIEERSAQVSMMGEIYKFARQVSVWLGPGNEHSQAAIDFVKTSGSSSRSFASNFSANSTEAAQTQMILDLIRRDYWQRAWIIQEVFQARTVKIHCGFDKLSWTTLAKFFRFVERQLLISSDNIDARELTEIYPSTTEIYHSTAFKLTKDKTSKNRDLYSLLLRYRTSLCSDTRDKMFSLCGLSKDYRQLVNYSQNAEELFRSLIVHFRDLKSRYSVSDVRSEVGIVQLAQEILGLPAPWLMGNYHGEHIYNRVHAPKREVPCRYIHQNLVSRVGPIISGAFCEKVEFLDWYRRFRGPSMPSLRRLRTAIKDLNIIDIQRLVSFKHTENTVPLLERLRQSAHSSKHGAVLLCGLFSDLHGVRLFTTHNGRLGFTSCDTQEGDSIIRFPGCDVSWVSYEERL